MTLEEGLINRGLWPVCGVDEAGRGPLAGPVVAAAVIISPSSFLRDIVKDSKSISPTKRERIYELLISSQDVHAGVGMVDEKGIDKVNILNATMLAMKYAVENLKLIPCAALVDGNSGPELPCECIPVVGGDKTEPLISAASIIAKVTRDRYMYDMENLYPGYGFKVHKGYPTKEHYNAIRRLGACQIHRMTFKGVLDESL